jgi:peptide/nickel transport system permease protein
MGEGVSLQEANELRERLGLDEPMYIQYWRWISGMFRGDFGQSFMFNKPVEEVIGDKLFLTVIVSFAAVLLTWILAIPIGIYSSVHQNSVGDYVFTLIGFIGLSIPNFMIALVIMYFIYAEFGILVGGLFSEEYLLAAWSWGKFVDLVKHLWLPALIVGTAGTAALIRTTRANMLDELRKPYVLTARAKGLSKWRTILKYPLRIAMNPFISTTGYLLPNLIGGGIIVAMVLGLPTLGPVLVNSLLGQDMYLAGTIVLLLGILTVVGTFISDLLLMWIDPRIRTEAR